jgi:hypothetical protein
MNRSSLIPQQFVNVASLEQLARSILADAAFVWETELWLDPIEKAKLAGEILSHDRGRVVARELLKASGRMDDMLASAIDLYQLYDDAGAAAADYDAAALMLRGREPLPLSDVLREAEPYMPEILVERGFSLDLYKSLMKAAQEIGMSFEGLEFTADEAGILLLGKHPHRLLRDAARVFPRVDGNTYVREGVLQTYHYIESKRETCTTDSFQALLALAKYGSEGYRARVSEALAAGLKPAPTGVAPFVVFVIVVVVAAVVAAIIISILCATKNADAKFCDISLQVLGAIISAGTCYLATQDPQGNVSCSLSKGGSDG